MFFQKRLMASEKLAGAVFLIDADNLSATAVDEAFRHMNKLGLTVSVRRAYGGHETLTGMKETLKRHAIRAFVNQGKGTTDVALAVDAMDLLHSTTVFATFAIGSSDADFSPLAVRLREGRVRVICFAQRDKSAEELVYAYDELIEVDPPKTFETVISATVCQKPALVKAPLPVSVPAISDKLPSPRSKEPVMEASKDEAKAVQRLLDALPAWLPNTIRQLNQMGVPLRASGIKTGNKPLHQLFGKYPGYFKVLPVTGPAKQVRLLKKP